ncbi:hypothetical protein [Bacteroides sp. 519]|uniref:hypothetical protein n=1 Tax=Bacteroides sp. 519 TaxID=2302937 RepID=UPI0013D60C27|nr:hypothetical protein [Bacteroides sp. 519]NDV59616.1 hypothetical protein [Bacteroides sp. 519]
MKRDIKRELFDSLKKNHALWSFEKPKLSEISDELLIEKVLLHLDIQDINKLFLIFPKTRIKNVWINSIIPLEPQYHSYNILFSTLYFDIKNPHRYIKVKTNQHIKSLLSKS